MPQMRTWSVEWSGIITRDIGWDDVRASSMEDAKKTFLLEHGQYRRVRSVILVDRNNDN